MFTSQEKDERSGYTGQTLIYATLQIFLYTLRARLAGEIPLWVRDPFQKNEIYPE